MSVSPSRNPVLSAVVCTHNRADLLRQTLESLSRQTLDHDSFEVVLIDDGSSDETREVARAFESKLPLRYSHQRNAGLASARNHGLFLACGDILLFLDDDVAHPNLLETHCDSHRRFSQPHYGVLGFTEIDPAIASDPLMHFVTQIGCFLFSFRACGTATSSTSAIFGEAVLRASALSCLSTACSTPCFASAARTLSWPSGFRGTASKSYTTRAPSAPWCDASATTTSAGDSSAKGSRTSYLAACTRTPPSSSVPRLPAPQRSGARSAHI